MGRRTLGLDLGSNSIGWALVDEEERRIVATGVRVFPEGVDRDQQGGEVSKSENRRILRGQRRQIARRSRRKRIIRQALVEAGLYPADPAEQAKLDAMDPYVLRRRGMVEKLTPFEFGRVLIHLNQRRGFLSNRKADRGRKRENSEMLQAISELAARMGNDTLGQHLAARVAPPGVPPTADHRVRGQHTRREMFYREFDALWEAQRPHHPKLLTDSLKYGEAGPQTFPASPQHGRKRSLLQRFGLHGLIFFQRPLYWPLDAVGFCELEPRLRRCPRADRLAQKVRILQEVNNLRYLDPAEGDEKPLSAQQRQQVIGLLCSSASRTFDEIRAELKFPEDVRFNLERLVEGGTASGGRTKLKGMETDALMAHKDLFGHAWYQRPEAERDAIVRHLIDPAQDDRATIALATTDWGLSQERAEKLLDVEPPPGYASFSRIAMEKLLPHLEAGLPLMRNDAPSSSPAGATAPADAIHAAGYLRPDERPSRVLAELPGPGQRGFPDLPNPIVQQALHEVRKIVNATIREYGRPDAIHIEMAREVKGSLEKRRRYRLDQWERQQQRERATAEIARMGIASTREAVARQLLWQAQGERCIYTGQPISPVQLFGGEVEVDHILPRGRSLDDSMGNKIVCLTAANRDKGQRTPWEWLVRDGDPKYDYEGVLQRARAMGDYGKFKRFTQKEVVLDDFIARQLNDTAYISRAVVQYVRQLGSDVVCSKGALTADLRWCWGLDRVLRDDGLSVKNREDHRHHAVDAIVIALTNRSRLQGLARLRATGEVLTDPWVDFAGSVSAAVNGINVSHRPQRSVHGPLHEQTIYGKVEGQPGVYVSRQPLEKLTPAMVPLIRDKAVRQKVEARLKEKGIDVGRGKGKIPPATWKEPLWMNREKGIRVTKVRVCKPEESVVPMPRNGGKEAAYVKPGSMHHLCIFEYLDGKKTRREAVFVSMLEAARRRRDGQTIIQRTHPTRPDARFVMSLSRGEAVLSPRGDGRLMIFNTAASTQGQIYFHHHCDARPASTREKFAVKANSMAREARKVTVDPLGRIRWAND